MEKKVTSHITKGILIALILFVLDLVAGFAHFRFATFWRWIPTGVLAVAIIWACYSYGSQMENKVTFGNLFAHGFKTSAVVACITLIFSFLTIYLIFPETRDQAIEQARKQMEDRGNVSDDQINQALDITRRLFLPLTIGTVILGTLIVGAIASLLGAAITKKTPQTPFDTQS